VLDLATIAKALRSENDVWLFSQSVVSCMEWYTISDSRDSIHIVFMTTSPKIIHIGEASNKDSFPAEFHNGQNEECLHVLLL
jgi:hypothetical protein